MPQSHTNLLVHLIFGTARRSPLIAASIQARLYDYLGGFVRGEDCVLYEIGGVEDHIHLLVQAHQSTALDKFMRDLKSHSSGWVHRTFPQMSHFAWQRGYGAFSVSQSAVPAVTSYIQNQREHHRTQSFREEYIRFLRANAISFDESYLDLPEHSRGPVRGAGEEDETT